MERSDPGDATLARAELAAVRGELAQSEKMRRQSNDREAMLVAELQHRVRNMLAIIRSIFGRTMGTATSLEEAADHFRGRLDTIARQHTQFVCAPQRRVELESLIRDELLNFGYSDGDQVSLAGPAVRLDFKESEAIALALHELATNSVKFGALSIENAQLAIRWTRQDDSDGNRVTLDWVEHGVPVVASAPIRNGFGREYIEQALPFQLDATTYFELRPGGLACRISFLTRASQSAR